MPKKSLFLPSPFLYQNLNCATNLDWPKKAIAIHWAHTHTRLAAIAWVIICYHHQLATSGSGCYNHQKSLQKEDYKVFVLR